jgi:hypothetical protein
MFTDGKRFLLFHNARQRLAIHDGNAVNSRAWQAQCKNARAKRSTH